jgi:hypothetical protein
MMNEYVKSPPELNDTDRLHGSASVLHDDQFGRGFVMQEVNGDAQSGSNGST